MKCTRTERKFKVDFLENKASKEKFVFYIFDFFFRLESTPFQIYIYMLMKRVLWTVTYIKRQKKDHQ